MRELKRGKWVIRSQFQHKLWDLIDKRARGNWTVFADICEIAHSTFTNYLAGTSEPKRELLNKICKGGKVNVSYFDDTDNMAPKNDADYGTPRVVARSSETTPTYQEPCPFMNPERAMKFKEALAYIEKKAPDDYRWLWEKARGKAEWLRDEEKKTKDAT